MTDWVTISAEDYRKLIAYVNLDERGELVRVVRGRWIKTDMHSGMEQYKCSVCNQECCVPTCMGEPLYSYCPNCGAKMDKEADNDN